MRKISILERASQPEKLDKLKKRLNKKPLLANVYLITPARNPADQLDIFDARQLVQPHYKDEEFLVLGMASGSRGCAAADRTGHRRVPESPEGTVICGSIYYVDDSF